ncbi:MAG: DUF3138 family protein [Burkholderiales bacterium]|nr:DUF3138 family protein [Burkholderiales bacterium]
MTCSIPVAALRRLAVASGLVFAAAAQAGGNDDILSELRALKARVAELEEKLQAQDAKLAQVAQTAQTADQSARGMTEEQQGEFNRIMVKTEALEDARDALGWKGLKISGYLDPTFIANQRQHRAGFQLLNPIDEGGYRYDNSYFGAAVIDFSKETEGGSRWRLSLAPNRGVGAALDGRSPVQEASVSIPLTDLQTRFIAGQMPDWSGYEYLPSTLNKLITHNLLFDFTLPAAYTGAGLELARRKWLFKGLLANVNASQRAQGGAAPALAYRVDYAKGEFQGFGFAGVHGPMKNARQAGHDSRLDLFEFDASFIRGDWTVQGQWSWGRQARAAIMPGADGRLADARWWGLSALAAYKFQPRLEGTLRYDLINNRSHGGGLLGTAAADDRNGIGPDATLGCDPLVAAVPGCERGVNRSALTFGLSYLFNLSTTFKLEYRLDQATGPVFLDTRSGTYQPSNQLFGASVLVSF